MRDCIRGVALALVAALAALATEAEALEQNLIDHIDYENGALDGMADHAGAAISHAVEEFTASNEVVLEGGVGDVASSYVVGTRFFTSGASNTENNGNLTVQSVVWNTSNTVITVDETLVAETASSAVSKPPRYITIWLNQAIAATVTQVLFNGGDVNSSALTGESVVRFDPATDAGFRADGTADASAVRVQVPPRIWPLPPATSARDPAWDPETPVQVAVGVETCLPVTFDYFRYPDVMYLSSEKYISGVGDWVMWDVGYIPTDKAYVDVEITDGGTTWTVPDANLTVTPEVLKVTLWEDTVPTPAPSALGEYDVTVKTYPGSKDEMSTDTYSNDRLGYNSAGEDMTIYIVHDAAELTDVVVDSPPLPAYPGYVPLSGNLALTISGNNFFEFTGAMPDSGTKVYIDGVEVAVDYGSLPALKVTLPPSADETEGWILVEVQNFGQSSRSGDDSKIAYKDFWPTVKMLAPVDGSTQSAPVRLQADARDDSAVTKVEYWYAVGVGPHYHPHNRGAGDTIYENYLIGTWNPHTDDQWDSDIDGGTGVWTLAGTVYAEDGFPYDYDWTPPSDGTYEVTAVVYDDRSGESQAQTPDPADGPAEVTVSAAAKKPPVVTISSPPNGASLYAAGADIPGFEIDISASAVDDVGTSMDDIDFFYLDAQGVERALGWPDPNIVSEGASAALAWEGNLDNGAGAEIDAPDGPLYIIAKATSNSGLIGYAAVEVNIVSDPVADLTISNVTPTTSDYAGANPATHVQVNVTIAGSGFVDDADHDLSVYFAGEKAGNVNIISSTQLTVDVPHLPDDLLDGGAVPIRIAITEPDDEDDVLRFAEHAGLFTVTDSAPRVEIESPQNGNNVGDGVVIVASPLDDRGITKLVFEVSDGSDWFEIGALTPEPRQDYISYPYSVVWNMSVAEVDPAGLLGYGSPHDIRVRVTDDEVDGTETYYENTVAWSLTPQDGTGEPFVNPPMVEIVSPAAGATVNGHVPITFTVTQLVSVPHAAIDFDATNREITLHADVGDATGDYAAGNKIVVQGATNAANNGTFEVAGVAFGANTVITVVETTLVDEDASAAPATVNNETQTIFLSGTPTLTVIDLGTGTVLDTVDSMWMGAETNLPYMTTTYETFSVPHTVASITAPSTITLQGALGDVSSYYLAGEKIEIAGATQAGNDGTFTVSDVTYGANTVITVSETTLVGEVAGAIVTNTTHGWNTDGLNEGPFYLIEARESDDQGNTGVGGANVAIGTPRPVFNGGDGGVCGGWDGDMPLPLLVVMMAVAVPLLVLRRRIRLARGRVR